MVEHYNLFHYCQSFLVCIFRKKGEYKDEKIEMLFTSSNYVSSHENKLPLLYHREPSCPPPQRSHYSVWHFKFPPFLCCGIYCISESQEPNSYSKKDNNAFNLEQKDTHWLVKLMNKLSCYSTLVIFKANLKCFSF